MRRRGVDVSPSALLARLMMALLVVAATAVRAGDDAGSVAHLVARIADAVEARARTEKLQGAVRIVLDDSRGVDAQRAAGVLLPRLKRALREPLVAGDGGIRARLSLSEDGATLWAVVVLEGASLMTPTTVAVSVPIDRELGTALGVALQRSAGRFVLSRTSSLPGGVLDATLVDIDGDTAEELVVLGVEAVTVYRIVDGERLERAGGPWALPTRRWPRVVLGWLVSLAHTQPHTVQVVTSAGHALLVDCRSGKMTPAVPEILPLRASSSSDPALFLRVRAGSPFLSLPLVARRAEGTPLVDVIVPGVPPRVRDLLRLPSRDAWAYVDEDGALGAATDDGNTVQLSPERVGDRLAAIDVDGDAEPELVTSSSAAPQEPDQLVLRRLAPDLSSTTILLRSPLSGGSVAALVVGHADFDARAELLVVEDLGAQAFVWRLERAP